MHLAVFNVDILQRKLWEFVIIIGIIIIITPQFFNHFFLEC